MNWWWAAAAAADLEHWHCPSKSGHLAGTEEDVEKEKDESTAVESADADWR